MSGLDFFMADGNFCGVEVSKPRSSCNGSVGEVLSTGVRDVSGKCGSVSQETLGTV